MPKFYGSISYDGSRFNGWQSQVGGGAVQDELQTFLGQFFKARIQVQGASRTDKGVHAFDQRIAFFAETPIPAIRLAGIFRDRLAGVRFHWLQEVEPGFCLKTEDHEKEYWYELAFGPAHPFYESYRFCLKKAPCSIEEFRRILKVYEGRHDFILFSKHDRSRVIEDTTRELFLLDCLEVDGGWRIRIQGDRFLWMMVRFLVAYALACADGFISLIDLKSMLEGSGYNRGNRPTVVAAPPGGLYLRSCRLKTDPQASF